MTSIKSMDIIHLFHRRINFTSRTSDILKGRRSVEHSLRMESAKTKELEWIPEFKDLNQIWVPKYGVLPLERFTYKAKKSLAEFIAPKPRIRNRGKLQKRLNDNRRKLRNALRAENESGHRKIGLVLKWLIEHPRAQSINLDLTRTAQLEMNRKSQRMRSIERYIEAHNRLVSAPQNENCVYVQEGILKIPHQWNVTTEQVSAEELIEVTKAFLKHYFPDYFVKAIIFHHDERKLNEHTGLYDDTGAHTHYYLSGRNINTGEYDLNYVQIKVVDAYMKQIGAKESLLVDADEKPTLSKQQTQIFGQYFQKMLYDYVNSELLNSKGLHAEFAPETVRKSLQRQKVNEQAKQPKALREFNMLQMNTEIAKKQLKELEHRLKFLQRVVEDTEHKASIQLSGILKDVYLRTYCREKNLNDRAMQYLLKVAKASEEHLSIEMKALLYDIATELDDTDLVSLLKPPA